MTELYARLEHDLHATDFAGGGDTVVLWSTPILRRIPEGADTVNQDLRRMVLDRAARDTGDRKSNVGGWHSGEDLLTWGGEAIAALQSWIVQGFQDLTTAMTGGELYDGQLELNAWAN